MRFTFLPWYTTQQRNMRIEFFKINILALLIMSTIYAQTDYASRPPHHTEDGFQNPYPGFVDHGFTDFFQWSVVERIKGEKPEKPDSYNFEIVSNDGQYLRQNEEKFTVTWVGHSTLLIQIDGLNILTDPIWSERCSPVQFAGPKRHVAPGIAFSDLPPIDIVIISHNHYDHLDRQTLLDLGNSPLYLVPLKIGAFLESIGITNYEELDWWDTIKFNGVTFACTPAQHFSNRSMFDRNKTLWSSWVIRGIRNSFYYGGDSGYFPGFKEILAKFGPFDIAALPIGAYLPRWFMAPVHLSPGEALDAFGDLGARIFLPIHWGTFELADEPLDQPVKELRKEIGLRGLDETKFWLLKHGETKTFDLDPRKITDKISTSYVR